jgi:hypothetical protein
MTATRPTGLAARSNLAYWACQALGWGFNAFAQTYTAAGNLQAPPTRLAIEVISINVLGLILSHLLRNFIKRHDWHTLGIAALLPRIGLASVLLGLPIGILMQFMSIADLWTGAVEEPEAAGKLAEWLLQLNPLLLRTLNWSALFVAWMVVYFSITSLRDRHLVELRQSELSRALQLAELRLLKSQLNPHFLFNSLNSVRALIADDPSGAQKAVTQLARTLRYTLSAGQEELVTLERELEIVEDYLALESLRLGERLCIERTIAPEVRGARMPVMLLQTIVENAIKHGIAELPQGGVLSIRAAMHEHTLSIEVENPRPPSSARASSQGVGLHNAAQRLRLLFGAHAAIELDLSRPDLALARIRIRQST